MTRVMSPRSSPDGQTLAFLTLVAGRSAGRRHEALLGRLDRPDASAPTPARVYKVCWSRDGDRLYFDRVTDVPRGIFSVSAARRRGARGPRGRAGARGAARREPPRRQARRRSATSRSIASARTRARSTPVGPAVVAEGGTLEPARVSRRKDGRLLGPPRRLRRTPRAASTLLDLATGKATPFAPQLPLAPPLAIGADGNSVLAFVNFGDLQQAISVSRDGAAGQDPLSRDRQAVGPGRGRRTAASSSARWTARPSSCASRATGGVPDPDRHDGGQPPDEPRAARRTAGLLIPNQVLGRRRLLIARARRAASAVPRLRRAGDAARGPRRREPRGVSLGQRRAAADASRSRRCPRAASSTPRGDARHRAAEPRGVAGRQDALLRQRGIALLGRRRGRHAEEAPPRQRRRPRCARARRRRSSCRSTARRRQALPRAVRRRLRALDSLREPAAARADPDLGRRRGPGRPDRRHRHLARHALPRRRPARPRRRASLERLPVVFDGDIQYPAWDRDGIAARRRRLDPQQPLEVPAPGEPKPGNTAPRRSRFPAYALPMRGMVKPAMPFPNGGVSCAPDSSCSSFSSSPHSPSSPKTRRRPGRCPASSRRRAPATPPARAGSAPSPTQMNCSGGFALFIDKGSYGNVQLDGLGAAFIGASKEGTTMMESMGDWDFMTIFIDEKATPEQRKALLAIVKRDLASRPRRRSARTSSTSRSRARSRARAHRDDRRRRRLLRAPDAGRDGRHAQDRRIRRAPIRFTRSTSRA